MTKLKYFIPAVVVGFLIVFNSLTYFYFKNDLQDPKVILNRNKKGVLLTDKNNKPFFSFYRSYPPRFTPLAQIPTHLKQAVILMEDKEFYTHPGYSIRGIARSVWLNMQQKDIIYGGSTITQQLVKNSFLTPKKSLVRKYQEILLAHRLEQIHSKEKILEMYLNSVYFGNNSFGIEAAAQNYFGKSAKDLTLAESTMLVGLIPAPSLANDRREEVLAKMHKQNYITTEQKNRATKETLAFKDADGDLNNVAPHFALMVRDDLINTFGEKQLMSSGFVVKTTLDLNLQKNAEEIAYQHVQRLSGNNASNAAVVVMDPKTGGVLALVGSKNWYDQGFGKVNLAQSPRSPGSAFKPIVYAAAFEKGIITPATMLRDMPTVFDRTYKPKNFDSKFRGMVPVRRGLANSLNVPSVEVMEKLGIEEAIETARKLGIHSLKDPTNYGLSLVLGGGEVSLLEMASSYSVFANGGLYNEPFLIESIKDKFQNEVYSYQNEPRRALSEETAFLISSILSDPNARREVFGSALNTSRNAAVKTGTSEDFRDAWTVGYTPNLTIGVWVGNNDNRPMSSVAGSLGAAPIWRNLMENAFVKLPPEQFERPDDVRLLTCRYTTTTTSSNDKTTTPASYFVREYFAKDSPLMGNCS